MSYDKLRLSRPRSLTAKEYAFFCEDTSYCVITNFQRDNQCENLFFLDIKRSNPFLITKYYL